MWLLGGPRYKVLPFNQAVNLAVLKWILARCEWNVNESHSPGSLVTPPTKMSPHPEVH